MVILLHIMLCGKNKVHSTQQLNTLKCSFSFLIFCIFTEKWPRTASGLPSTAGTTASIAFIRRGKIFIGHVGDSGIILGVLY